MPQVCHVACGVEYMTDMTCPASVGFGTRYCRVMRCLDISHWKERDLELAEPIIRLELLPALPSIFQCLLFLVDTMGGKCHNFRGQGIPRGECAVASDTDLPSYYGGRGKKSTPCTVSNRVCGLTVLTVKIRILELYRFSQVPPGFISNFEWQIYCSGGTSRPLP